MSLPVSTEPVKVTLPTPLCSTSGAPQPGPSPERMLRMPGGSTWFMIWQARSTASRLLGGFDDDGIAGDERGRDLERHQQERHVPGDDRADHADRLALGDGEHAGLEGHALALELGAEPAIEDQDIGEDARLDAALGANGLAGLEGDEPRDLLDMVGEQAAAIIDELAALARSELGPG